MNRNVLTLPLLALGLSCPARPQAGAQPTKIAIIHIQNAIISTRDGQKAAGELQARYDPRRKELEKKQNDIAALQDQLRKGSNTMSEEGKQKLMREIDQKTKSLNRDTEDAQTEFDQDQGKLLQDLGQRLMVVIDKYARDNGYVLVLDISAPQTPVLYASNGIDITNDIVSLYDKNAPSAAPPQPSAAKSPSPPPATPAKKQPGTVK